MEINLQVASQNNLKYMLEQLGEKLGVANRMLFDEQDYDITRYHDLKFLYEHIMKADSISPSETQAFIDELRTVRKES